MNISRIFIRLAFTKRSFKGQLRSQVKLCCDQSEGSNLFFHRVLPARKYKLFLTKKSSIQAQVQGSTYGGLFSTIGIGFGQLEAN